MQVSVVQFRPWAPCKLLDYLLKSHLLEIPSVLEILLVLPWYQYLRGTRSTHNSSLCFHREELEIAHRKSATLLLANICRTDSCGIGPKPKTGVSMFSKTVRADGDIGTRNRQVKSGRVAI
jgi:hypothetical protein